MAKMTYQQKKRLPDSAFALSGRRFPIHDEAHARNALARGHQSMDKGNLSAAEFATLIRKVQAKYPNIEVSPELLRRIRRK